MINSDCDINKNGNTKKSDDKMYLSEYLYENIKIFRQVFNKDDTVIFREFESKEYSKCKIRFCVIFVDPMINSERVTESIIYPLISKDIKNVNNLNNILDEMSKSILTAQQLKQETDINVITESILYGYTALLVDGCNEILLIDTKGWEARSITEPNTEPVIRGPREGFTEKISVNISLIRRKILSPDLKFSIRELGTRTKTKICICYIDNLASPKIIQELDARLNNINIDGIIESGYIEELIKDSPLSPFRTIGATERPDIVSSKLLEGRVALLCDGTPVALTLPFIFMEYFQASEDYYNNFIFSSFNRMLRTLSFFISTSVLSIWVALCSYHQELIPTALIISILNSTQGLPFPIVLEALLLMFGFEILREAGSRLPKAIGQAVSIVGALVIGEAAVNARLVSPSIVIMGAISGISTFLLPQMVGPIVIIKLIFLIIASILGLYGYIFSVIGLFIHLMSMKSFGVPYMVNLASFNFQDIKDTAIRAPWWLMYVRPKLIAKDSIRKAKAK